MPAFPPCVCKCHPGHTDKPLRLPGYLLSLPHDTHPQIMSAAPPLPATSAPFAAGWGDPALALCQGSRMGGCCLDVSSLLKVHSVSRVAEEAREPLVKCMLARGQLHGSTLWRGGSLGGGTRGNQLPFHVLCSEGPHPYLRGGICTLSSLGGKTQQTAPQRPASRSPSAACPSLTPSLHDLGSLQAQSLGGEPGISPPLLTWFIPTATLFTGARTGRHLALQGSGPHLGTPWLSGLGELLASRVGARDAAPPPENDPALCPQHWGSPDYSRDCGPD